MSKQYKSCVPEDDVVRATNIVEEASISAHKYGVPEGEESAYNVGWLSMYCVHLEKALLEVSNAVAEDDLRTMSTHHLVTRVRKTIGEDTDD